MTRYFFSIYVPIVVGLFAIVNIPSVIGYFLRLGKSKVVVIDVEQRRRELNAAVTFPTRH